MVAIAHLSGIFETIPDIHPYTFDANPRAVEGTLVHIAVTSQGERIGPYG